MHPEGKYVVDIDKKIKIDKCTPGTRVALRNDSYYLHKILPTKVISIPITTITHIHTHAHL